MKKVVSLIITAAVALGASAALVDRPTGIRIGQRMTVRPYVSVYYTWDSNHDSSSNGDSGGASSFTVSPGFSFSYIGQELEVDGSAYYQYHSYTEYSNERNEHAYGENLGVTWSDCKSGGKGWNLVLRESYQRILEDDDMSNSNGRGIGRDRDQFNLAASAERNITDKLHADVNTTFYMIDYDNDSDKYAELYGWTRWTVGAQAGYAFSQWTDVFLSGTYQGYTQDNDCHGAQYADSVSDESNGYTIHVGIGSRATERISYRLSGGWSYFEYGDEYDDSGFTYTASGTWRIGETWSAMGMASSYYQPSESSIGTAQRTDSVSLGVSHAMIRGKLNSNFDMQYRHEDNENGVSRAALYRQDILTFRLGLSYTINRFVSTFGNVEYQTDFFSDDNGADTDWDYDRWRLSFGFQFTY